MKCLKLSVGIVFISIAGFIWMVSCQSATNTDELKRNSPTSSILWKAPDTSTIPYTSEGNLIRYGRELIDHTAIYFGPKGKISRAANGMNCQNCHIDGGTRIWGNNFSLVASTYPRFRSRSGRTESIEFRVNDCMERSMNGQPIDSLSEEMKAFVAYLKWVGKDVPKKAMLFGAGTEKLTFLDRAADPDKGKMVYISKCKVCHGENGAGLLNADSSEYVYPPLWGPYSYNIGAGLYRISGFAGYVKNNMPFGTTYRNAQLTDEEAWDVAAFVNSQPHPDKDLSKDWPNITDKPMDYPFGPYADSFPEQHHKYGPYTMMGAVSNR